MSAFNVRKNNGTFHVPLTLEHDERVTSAAAVLVPDNPHPFNAAEPLKLPSEVILRGILVLRQNISAGPAGSMCIHTRRDMKSVL